MPPSADLSLTEPPIALRKRLSVRRRRVAVTVFDRASMHRAGLVACAVLAISGLTAVACFVGADARWLAALGQGITRLGAIPTGIPFASAPTSHWPNAIALAELAFHGLEVSLGDRGLMIAQVLAVALALAVLARDAQRGGATAAGTAGALLIAAAGSFPSLAVARVQLFSLVLFPVLILLLRRETLAPSQRIWLVVPLLALWSNLHGAAVVGLIVTLTYLVFDRMRRDARTAAAVGIAAAVAMLATPAGLRTLAYYHGVLTNAAAARGAGMWGPLSLSAPLDLVLIGCACALGWRLRRVRPPLWEALVGLGLVVLTINASRSGVWLLFFLAPLAAKTFHPKRTWNRLLPALALVGLVTATLAVIRGPVATGASSALVAKAIALAHGTPILADDVVAEQVALAGGRIWVGDPIDAFSKHDQGVYLEWSEGKSAGVHALGRDINVVLTSAHSDARRLMHLRPGFRPSVSDTTAELFVRTG